MTFPACDACGSREGTVQIGSRTYCRPCGADVSTVKAELLGSTADEDKRPLVKKIHVAETLRQNFHVYRSMCIFPLPGHDERGVDRCDCGAVATKEHDGNGTYCEGCYPEARGRRPW